MAINNDTIINLQGQPGTTVIGGNGSQEITMTGNNDVVFSRGGDDIIYSGHGRDLVNSGSGNDTVYAGAGNDVVNGKSGDDLLDGGGQDDLLVGAEDNDTLIGGNDDDILWGDTTDNAGGYADVFVFDNDDGNDVIKDFEVGVDTIGLLDGAGSLAINFDGTDTTITYGSTTITVEDAEVTLADIDTGFIL